MRIACVQVATVDGEVAANRSRALRLTQQALAQGTDLAILPELVTTGYCTDEYLAVAEGIDGQTVRAFAKLAASSGASIALGLVTRASDGRPQNGSVLIGPHGVVGTYAKTHLCVNDDPRVDESTAFAAGEALGLFELCGVRVGMMICYDGQHGELPVALVAGGADLLVWLNNRTSMPVWEASAIARFNRVPVAAVNRVGIAGWQPAAAPAPLFTGVSALVDHDGETIAAAEGGEETVVVGNVEIEAGRRRRASHVLNTQHTEMASPKAITERGEAFSRDPIGTGPFKFNSWEDDVKILYDRFDDYNWGPSFLRHTGAPYPDRFRIQILGFNMTDNAQAFEANEVDICLNWSFADFKRVSENAKYHVIGFAAPGMGQYMPLHTQLWPLDDLNVRKALLFGVDRRTVTVRANGGIAPTNISNLLLPGTIGHSEEAGELYTYDPARGNQILDEAGYAKREDGFRYAPDGRRLEITYPDRGDPVVELFKPDVEKSLGIFVDIPKMDEATHREGASKGLYHTTWIGVAAPSGDILYERFHTGSYGGANRSYSFFEYDGIPSSATPGAKIDRLLETARASFDQAEQIALWKEAELYLMENAVAIPLVVEFLPWLTNPDRIGGELFLGIDYLPFFGQFYSTQE